jgi:hypothetical protein
MRLPVAYIAFGLVVLGVFSYAKYRGLSLADGGATGRGGHSHGFSYVGTSSGYHK